MKQVHSVGFIGGDSRQQYMIELWRTVPCFAPDANLFVYGRRKQEYAEPVTECSTLVELANICNILVCPIPFSRDGKSIVCDFPKDEVPEDMQLSHLASCLKQGHRLFGGNLTQSLMEHCNMNGIWYCDFMKMEDVARKNAIATAEGAIAEAVYGSTGNLHRSSCLLIGYGRCGRVLAERLKGMGARVDIWEKQREMSPLLYVDGYEPLDFTQIIERLGQYDYIFNTAPSKVLTRPRIARLKKESVVIDIASMPGGVDREAMNEYGIPLIHALGLPGKYAPRASAEILVRAMKRALE